MSVGRVHVQKPTPRSPMNSWIFAFTSRKKQLRLRLRGPNLATNKWVGMHYLDETLMPVEAVTEVGD